MAARSRTGTGATSAPARSKFRAMTDAGNCHGDGQGRPGAQTPERRGADDESRSSLIRAAFNWGVRPATSIPHLQEIDHVIEDLEGSRATSTSEGDEGNGSEGLRSALAESEDEDAGVCPTGTPAPADRGGGARNGCRRGELLSLQWWQVKTGRTEPAVDLPAAKTRRRDRVVPISTRLNAI